MHDGAPENGHSAPDVALPLWHVHLFIEHWLVDKSMSNPEKHSLHSKPFVQEAPVAANPLAHLHIV
jgi:hypothetical protein